jgi:soluble lytic murein transglycosylase-like protein
MLIEIALCLLTGVANSFCVGKVPVEYRAFVMAQHEEHDQVILTSAVQWNIDPFMLKGLLWTESKMRPGAEHETTKALGIAQFTASGRRAMEVIWKKRGLRRSFGRADALDPEKAIPASAEMLSYLTGRCGSFSRALAAYNTGSCRFRQRGFVLRVTKHANRFRTESGLPPLPSPFKRAQALRRLPTS